MVPWPLDVGRNNDDHPPHNVGEGQRLVGKVFNMLLRWPDREL